MSDTPSRVLDFALDTFAAETLVGGLQAFACLVTRLWRTLPSTGCFVGRIARFLRKLVVLEGVRSRLCSRASPGCVQGDTSGTSGSRPPAQAGNFHRFPIFGAFRHRGMGCGTAQGYRDCRYDLLSEIIDNF